MAVLDKEIYLYRFEKTTLEDFTKPRRKVISGNMKEVDNFLFNTLCELNKNYKNASFEEIFLYNVLVIIYKKLRKVYDKDMMRVLTWFTQQVLFPNKHFRIPLIEIYRYEVKNKIYKEYSILSDYILSNLEKRPFVDHSLYEMDDYCEPIKDFILMSYELATESKCKTNIFESVVEQYNKKEIIAILGVMIYKTGISNIFKAYIIAIPDEEFTCNIDNKFYYLGLVAIQFTKFMLNNEFSDKMIIK